MSLATVMECHVMVWMVWCGLVYVYFRCIYQCSPYIFIYLHIFDIYIYILNKYIYTISIALWAKSRFSGKIQVLNFVTRILNGTIENRVLGYLQDQWEDNGSIHKPFWLTHAETGISIRHR